MKTNDIKKGWRIQLRNGWFGTMLDNTRGNIRLVEVEGIYTEAGSVYSHDIERAWDPDSWPVADGVESLCAYNIEHTPAQIKLRETVEAF